MKLWSQYIKMNEILLMSKSAERTGNWELYLCVLQQMLPFLAAAGHNHYTRSARWFLQNMRDLPNTHPNLHNMFQKGFFVVRRSSQYWTGISPDLCIEQSLMCSLKSSGGLTRGRGMDEITRNIWILSRPVCTSTIEHLRSLLNINYQTSYQHAKLSEAVLKRDQEDMRIMTEFVAERNIFGGDLRNIANGVTASSSVNVEDCISVGEKILLKMTDSPVKEYVFKKADKAIPMPCLSVIKIGNETTSIDPMLLFQRLILILTQSDENMEDILKYELSTIPTALFDDTCMMRDPSKAKLAEHLWKQQESHKYVDNIENCSYVLDGGALLHKIEWDRGDKFGDILDQYVKHIKINYVKSTTEDVTVVFDSYDSNPTTKDHTHIRRTGGHEGPTIDFMEMTSFSSNKKTFLSNHLNKQRFINILALRLERHGINVIHSIGDADYLVAKTAAEKSVSSNVVCVADDTDILVLLLHHAKRSTFSLYLDASSSNATRPQWNIFETQKFLGPQIISKILFIHGYLGCDTVSSIYNKGKVALLNKIENIKNAAAHFYDPDASAETIAEMGADVMLILYNNKHCATLNELRKFQYNLKVATSKNFVHAKALPPTRNASTQHSFRVYLQVQSWLGNIKDPLQWGWQLQFGKLWPVPMTQPAAPERLLQFLRCSCTTDCTHSSCSCKKYTIPCSPLCSNCRGVSCCNVERSHVEEVDNEVP